MNWNDTPAPVTPPLYRRILRAHRVARVVHAAQLDAVKEYRVFWQWAHFKPLAVILVFILLMASCVLCSGALVPGVGAAQSCATPAMTFATLTACRTQTARALVASSTPRPTASPTRTLSAQLTPTRIETNTAIPAAERTRTAGQYAIEHCWFPPDAPADSRGVCSLYPFGSRFTERIVQVQP